MILAAATYLERARLLPIAGAQLVREDALERAVAIVVLAGGTPEREIAASDLYRGGWAPRVVVTVEPPRPALDALRRRGVHVPSEIDERVRYLVDLGVPRPAIVVLPDPIESTFAEASEVRGWVPADAHALIVVTSAFHAARAGFVFDRALRGTGVRVILRPSAAEQFDPRQWWRTRTGLRDGFFEWQKLIFYRIRYCCS
jgi:uncharacterized SAM-binding protein YcdF (DUF218 family)